MNLTRHLLESGSYEIARCGPSGILLKNRSSAATDDQSGNIELAQCLNQEFERAQQVLNQRQR